MEAGADVEHAKRVYKGIRPPKEEMHAFLDKVAAGHWRQVRVGEGKGVRVSQVGGRGGVGLPGLGGPGEGGLGWGLPCAMGGRCVLFVWF